ncbi:hypothetical protein BDM02DRAFT_3265237, partial [Thelephora ganbajun]
MPRKKGARNNTVPLRHTRNEKPTALESASDDSGRISRSPTPVWSRGASSNHSSQADQHAKLEAPQPPGDQPEEDEFMPTTQEVAATLVAMKSRRLDSENRGHEQGLSVQVQSRTGTEILSRVSPLFSYPLGGDLRTETYLSEDITWPTFIKICSDNMRLREGSKPKLAYKFSDGRPSKDWITLQDEDAYKHLMKTAAKRIRDRAKKESNLKDADLGFRWRIDLRVTNKVKRIKEEGEEDEDTAESEKGKEKEKTKKKKRSKNVPAKRKHGGQKKSLKKAKPSTPSSGVGVSSVSDADSESENGDTSDMRTVTRLQRENHCAWCGAPCVI